MRTLNLISNPLVEHKLSFLRDVNTGSAEFREITKEISRILAYEAMKSWDEIKVTKIQTPICETKVKRVSNPPIIVSIMRAGNGMMDAILSMIPFASAGHIGIYRDKYIGNTVEYYFKLPEKMKQKTIYLCDPMIATADTAIAAIDRLKQYEVGKIKILSILASPSGIEKIHHFHPDVDIYTTSKEEGLNEKGYLIPGLGDAGDRLFKTK